MPALFRTSADAVPPFERLIEEFRRRVKTQRALPTEDSAVILLFGLVATRQKLLRKGDRCARRREADATLGGSIRRARVTARVSD